MMTTIEDYSKKINHIIYGLKSQIGNAKLRNDSYDAGYLTAILKEVEELLPPQLQCNVCLGVDFEDCEYCEGTGVSFEMPEYYAAHSHKKSKMSDSPVTAVFDQNQKLIGLEFEIVDDVYKNAHAYFDIGRKEVRLGEFPDALAFENGHVIKSIKNKLDLNAIRIRNTRVESSPSLDSLTYADITQAVLAVDVSPPLGYYCAQNECIKPTNAACSFLRETGKILNTSTESHNSLLNPPRIGQLWKDQGGIYVGIIGGENGAPDYYLVHAEQEHEMVDVDWKTACESAKENINGFTDWSLPDRREAYLLSINTPTGFGTREWYWTATQVADNPVYAWSQLFGNGGQSVARKSDECRSRSVRRISMIK